MRPIINIVEQIHHDLMEQKENAIMKAVSKFDVVVDKERLMQALKDAKAFYDEGYRDAMNTIESIQAAGVVYYLYGEQIEMTAIEYMEKQIRKHQMSLNRETVRGATPEILQNIVSKVGYYTAAVEALKVVKHDG